eukprot:2735507-Pleurochrysis_carterae.AAC.2
MPWPAVAIAWPLASREGGPLQRTLATEAVSAFFLAQQLREVLEPKPERPHAHGCFVTFGGAMAAHSTSRQPKTIVTYRLASRYPTR